MEYVNQKFIEKREKVDWKAVAFEAAVGGVGAVFGGGGRQVAEGVGNAVGGVAKKVVKAAATEALWGGVGLYCGLPEACQGEESPCPGRG